MAAANREEKAVERGSTAAGAFEALESQASFDRVLFDGGEFGTRREIGQPTRSSTSSACPGLLEPDQVAALLRQRQADQLSGARRRRAADERPRWTTASRRSCARLSQLVGAWARKSGQTHGSVHDELRRRCGGPEVALADPDQLTSRVAWCAAGSSGRSSRFNSRFRKRCLIMWTGRAAVKLQVRALDA